MALSEFETKRCEKLISEYVDRRRPPVYIRPDLEDILAACGLEVAHLQAGCRGKECRRFYRSGLS